MTEAALAVLEEIRKAGIPYITATHDVKNPASGNVMKRMGMTYRYSYEEPWQPKNILVTFRMYQLNLSGVGAPGNQYNHKTPPYMEPIFIVVPAFL